VQNRGKRAVRLVPADTEFAAIFVPSCARAKPAAIAKIPNLSAELAPSKNIPRSVKGFQTARPKITLEEEETMMPIKEVTAKPTGIVTSCGHSASLGSRAYLVKSGLLMTRAAKFAIQFMILFTNTHAKVLPCTVLG
jgi:hypothetical protein